ncbi:11082_t:CDS:1, partial [Acaulospora colombiana]
MAANGATTSTFASLLKQSKFASYSPSIAQVYTTYGGHASRGDWGVKRPLSARKRNKALLIQSIDSREQQTEFRSGEPEAKMVQRWEETGKDVIPSAKALGGTSWSAQYANRPRGELPIDSEFSAYTDTPDPLAGPAGANPALRVKTAPSIEATPNPYLMSEREFNRYLERVRTFRPAFRKYIRAQEIAEANRVGKDIPDILQSPPNLYRMRREKRGESMTGSFLNEMAYQLHGAPESQTLEPYPHRNGGLYYPIPNAFQTTLLHPPIPAHFTSVDSESTYVSAAGMNVK